jgi:adenylate kinase family enzyme
MARIVLLGCAGTGKTRLARAWAARTGAPAILLDAIWQEGWGPPEVPAFRDVIRPLHAGEAWISDGNFAVATFDIRLPRATQVVWMEAPRWLCLWRAVRRVFEPGNDHRIGRLRRVIAFIWNFDRINRPRIEVLRQQHGPDVPVVHLRTRRDVVRFLAAAR